MKNEQPIPSPLGPDSRVREEPLRAVAGLAFARTLGAWRGRSGRRYVVCVRRLEGADRDLVDVGEADFGDADLGDAVLIAVARGDDGAGRVVAVASAGRLLARRRRRAWLTGLARRGAIELHLHRLAASEAERRAIAADLAPRREHAREAAVPEPAGNRPSGNGSAASRSAAGGSEAGGAVARPRLSNSLGDRIEPVLRRA